MMDVLSLLAKIPRGKVTTYAELAKITGLHPRTVAQILKENKHPNKFQCYKVVMSNSTVGGYSARGGVREKIRRLRADGAEVKKGKIDLKKYLWRNK